jgi:poly-beta-1,6-N-acetyl-D-glucosamine synthase
MSGALKYALITAARNELQYIELTLQSVIKQTELPIRWIIVSDGSTDGTDELVQEYALRHKWIELLRLPNQERRSFAGKARSVTV